jgi:hypothetical protein
MRVHFAGVISLFVFVAGECCHHSLSVFAEYTLVEGLYLLELALFRSFSKYDDVCLIRIFLNQCLILRAGM